MLAFWPIISCGVVALAVGGAGAVDVLLIGQVINSSPTALALVLLLVSRSRIFSRGNAESGTRDKAVDSASRALRTGVLL